MDNVFYRGHQFAGLPAYGLSRFQDDLQVGVAAAEIFQNLHQLFPVVVLAGNVVAASEVHPFHLGQELSELRFKSLQHPFQGVGVLFAQGVKMQALDTVQQFRLEFTLGNAQPGELSAGVVDVGFYGRKFRIHPDASADACC